MAAETHSQPIDVPVAGVTLQNQCAGGATGAETTKERLMAKVDTPTPTPTPTHPHTHKHTHDERAPYGKGRHTQRHTNTRAHTHSLTHTLTHDERALHSKGRYIYVCVCVCVYVCVYAYMYVCINVCMYVHTYYVLISPPMPYIASSPLCLLRVFAS